jgi:uncharacterized RDD family membrane protein YckC
MENNESQNSATHSTSSKELNPQVNQMMKVNNVDTGTASNIASFKTPNHLAGKNPRMASFLERLVAFILDSLILTLVGFILGSVIGIFSGLLNSINTAGADILAGLVDISLLIVSYGASFFYYAYFLSKKGQTPGGMVMKIKVVDKDTLIYLTPGKAVLRTLVSIGSSIAFNLGYLWYFMSEKRQTWHDTAVNAIVVKTNEGGDIYMDGEDKYKKEPVKAFLPCGCMVLFTIVATVLTVIAISEITKAFMNNPQFRNSFDSSGEFNMTVPGMDEYLNSEEDMDELNKKLNEYYDTKLDDLNSIPGNEVPENLIDPFTGMMCGGIAGIECPTGYNCEMADNYPDAAGICVKTEVF